MPACTKNCELVFHMTGHRHLMDCEAYDDSPGCPTCGAPRPELHPHPTTPCPDAFHARAQEKTMKNGGYALTLSVDTVGEVLRDYGRRAVAQRQSFLRVRLVGEAGKELPETATIFPEGKEGTTWNVFINSVTGGRNQFDVTAETLLDEMEDAVYCGPVRSS